MDVMDMEIVFWASVSVIQDMTETTAVRVFVLFCVLARVITSMVSVCASLGGREESATSDMRNVRSQTAVVMVIVKMEAVSA